MTDEPVVHLADRRRRLTAAEDHDDRGVVERHLVAQNEELLRRMAEQSSKIDRLVRSVETLAAEMHGFRTGKKDGAYARVAREDEAPDLLSAKVDYALAYTHSAEDIGQALGFNASQVGLLLGASGLKWTGNPDYEETTRWKKGRTRFFHKDVLDKVRVILTDREPDEFGIGDRAVCGMFRAFKLRDRQSVMDS